MKWEKGDIIVLEDRGDVVEREIVEVHNGYYIWRYPDVPEKEFDSRNSNDELMEHFWKLKSSKNG